MKLFMNPMCLRAPEPDPDNSGGGGGVDNAGFTDAQLKVFGNMMNTVMSSHLKRLPSFEDQIKATNWQEILAPVIKASIPEPSTEEKGKSKTPELSEYEKQLAKMAADMEGFKKQAIDAENKAKASEAARRHDAGKMRLRSALTGQVNEHALDHVVNHLTLVSNRLVVDDDGSVRLKVTKPELPGFPPTEQELPLETAIKDVLSESEMKIFLPAPKGGGSNPGPGAKGGITSASFTGEPKTDAEKLMRAAVFEKELRAKLGITD